MPPGKTKVESPLLPMIQPVIGWGDHSINHGLISTQIERNTDYSLSGGNPLLNRCLIKFQKLVFNRVKKMNISLCLLVMSSSLW